MIVLFHITLFLLGKLNKTNEDWFIDVNINWKRYPLCYNMKYNSFASDNLLIE